MVRLSEEAKALYAKYVGPDGKLTIPDYLPEEVKESFQFFNDHNINILEMNLDVNSINMGSEESGEEVDLGDVVEDDFDDTDDSGDMDIVDDIDEDDSDVDMSDLDSIF